QAPPMPWGVKRSAVCAMVESWSPAIDSVWLERFNALRGPWRYLIPVLSRIPVVNDYPPGIARARFAGSPGASGSAESARA
ncbi:MAG: hypothetical protein AAGC55_31515, partial [Myxococcota bacterium]